MANYNLNENNRVSSESGLGAQVTVEGYKYIRLDVVEEQLNSIVSQVRYTLGLEETEKQEGRTKVRSRVRGSVRNGPVVVRNIRPKTTSGKPTDKDELREYIRSLVFELCAQSGLNVPMSWNKAYRLLESATGFDVDRTKSRENIEKGSKLDIVFDKGMEDKLADVLTRYLDM